MRFILGSLIPILFCQGIAAQQNNMAFNRLTTEMGLSNGDVRSIAQDHYGYIWIGTTDGLNRYNGIEFEVYKNDEKDTTSIPNSYINYLYEDKKNNLWISTFGGLCRYDPKKNNFERIRFVDEQGTIFNTTVNCIVEDNSNNLWIGTLNGLFKFDRNKKLFLRGIDDSKNKLITSNCTFMCIDKFGAVWATLDDGKNVDVIKFNPVTKEFITYTTNHSIYKINNNTAFRLMADKDNNIWVGYYSGGIDVINEKNRTIQYYQSIPNDKHSLSSGYINSIIQDIDGTIFIGTRNGLNVYNPQKRWFYNFKSSESDKSLIGNEITCLFASPQGTLWIGCWGSGVSVYDKRLSRFAHFKQDKDPKKSLNGTSVTSFAEDKNGRIWISTDGGGLNLFSPTDENFIPIAGTEKLTNNKILSLEIDHSGGLWTGMWEGGLNCFKTEENKIFLKQKYNYLDELNTKSNSVFKTYCDKNNDIYVGTFSAGAYKLDTKTNKFKQILSKYSVLNIFRDSQNDLWLATLGNGLLRINPQKGDTDVFITNPKDTTSLSSPTVNIVFEDSKKRIWVGVDYGGLNLFDRKKKTFTRFTTEQGLPDNSIVGILEDNSGNLWISSHVGLSKAKIDTVQGKLKLTFRNFTVQDGLQSKVFNRWAYHKSKKGEMYFGGLNGFNKFYPDSIRENTIAPPVLITNLLLFNKPVTLKSPNTPLKQDISETKELVLTYNQSFFTLRFIALNYIYSEKNKYAYILSGFDKDWNYVGSKREATYTNLEPGRYTFKVIACNNDGVWNDNGASISIIILPPWWKTWWFRVLSILTIIIIGVSIYFTKTNQYKKRKLLLEREVDERTRALNEASLYLSQKTEAIAWLSEFGKKITSTLNFESVKSLLTEYLRSFIKNANLEIGIYDSHCGSLLFPNFVDQELSTPSCRVFLNDTANILARSFNNREIIFSNHFLNEYPQYTSFLENQTELRPASVICIPLLAEKKQIGVLFIYSLTTEAFSSEDFAIIQTLASYVAIALENANIYRALEENNSKLKSQAEILNERNTLLEERQQQIEEQAEELKVTNEKLLEKQYKIEEQAEELKVHSENLKDINDILVDNSSLKMLITN